MNSGIVLMEFGIQELLLRQLNGVYESILKSMKKIHQFPYSRR